MDTNISSDDENDENIVALKPPSKIYKPGKREICTFITIEHVYSKRYIFFLDLFLYYTILILCCNMMKCYIFSLMFYMFIKIYVI